MCKLLMHLAAWASILFVRLSHSKGSNNAAVDKKYGMKAKYIEQVSSLPLIPPTRQPLTYILMQHIWATQTENMTDSCTD